MVVDQVFRYFQHGKFEEAIDLIDEHLTGIERGSREFIRFNILKSRLYYHLGRHDQALYFIKEVEQYQADLEVLSYKAIYLFTHGDHQQAKQLLDQLTIEEYNQQDLDSLAGISAYYFAEGLVMEFAGMLEQAKDRFTESLQFRELLDDQYESNIIYYKLATIERQQGNLAIATQYLKQSLRLSTELDLLKEMATTSTLLGQDLLMQTNYDDATTYLEDGVEYWKAHSSPFGIIWAIAELAIVNYLAGNKKLALNQYTEIIEYAEDIMPPFHMSGHLLNVIRFAVNADQPELAGKFLNQLKQLANTNANPFISDRANLAELMISRHKARISTKLQLLPAFDHLSTTAKEAMIGYQSVIEIIQLLLLEYRITENQVTKDEILDEADDRISQLLSYIHLNMGISFELHLAVLRSKLGILRYDPKPLAELDQLIENQPEIDPSAFIEDWSEPSDEEIGFNNFDFKKEFQSIPTLKILLYLLPRPSATFSELVAATDLSSGHLSGKCSKLEEVGYISRQKQFIDEQMLTSFSITSKGYIELKQYLSKLSDYLEQLF